MIIHEICHVLAAVWVGQKPKILGIGFWKPYLSFTWREIEFRVTPFLLGGYVSFHENLMMSKEVIKKLSGKDQCIIYLGGCLGNIFTGGISLLLFYIIYSPSIFTLSLLSFGLMSVVLAVGNLIPIPPMDGWQIVQCGIEEFRGKQFSYKTNVVLTYAGIFFLSFVSMIAVLYYLF